MERHIQRTQTPTFFIYSDVQEGKHKPEDLERLIPPHILYSQLVQIIQIQRCVVYCIKLDMSISYVWPCRTGCLYERMVAYCKESHEWPRLTVTGVDREKSCAHHMINLLWLCMWCMAWRRVVLFTTMDSLLQTVFRFISYVNISNTNPDCSLSLILKIE